MEKNVLEIKSLNGNLYIYNYEYNLIQSKDIYDHQKVEEMAIRYKSVIHEIAEEDFLNNEQYEKYRCLCLILTDDCNFRCSYCANSSVYKYSKGYKRKTMDYKTLDKALYFYYEKYKKNIIKDPNIKFTIVFYGGEPLLEFEKIKYVIKKVENEFHIKKPIYSVTTNGYVLNDAMVDIFKQYRFDVNVSMDGYKEIHNLNRRTKSGKETFEKVVKNFRKLYATLGKDSVGVITTFDRQVSPERLYTFYKENPDIDSCLRRVASVTDINTAYYEMTPAYSDYDKELNYLYKLYHEGDRLNFLKRLFKDKFDIIVQRNTFSNYLYSICSPISAKLTVATNGTLHICEKVNENYPIGDVDNGIDKTKAYQYYKNAIDIRNRYCKNCKISNICIPCFAQTNRDGKEFILKEEQCQALKRSILHVLEIYCTFMDTDEWPLEFNSDINQELIEKI